MPDFAEQPKKLLAPSVGICCASIAAVIAEFRRRPTDASAADLDVRVAEAFRADAQAQMSAMASSVAESLKEPGAVCHRSASMLSCGGRVPFRYPYAPKRGVSRKALAKFGCKDGKVRATPEARRIVAVSGAQLDSFQDAQTFKECGAIRTLDFVHAYSYLHTLLETLSAPGECAPDYKRFKGILKKWGGKSLMKNLGKKFGFALEATGGDAGKALACLKERVWMMDYRLLRKNGFYIGSGMIESVCKTLVAARCKLAGRHWRHKNAAGIALLRATLRSNFRIPA